VSGPTGPLTGSTDVAYDSAMSETPPSDRSALLESRFASYGNESELWVPRALERLRTLLGRRALHAARGLYAARARP
jgi:hypothetical protein